MSELVIVQASDLKELIVQAVRTEIGKLSLSVPAQGQDELMSIDEAATFLKLSKQTLYAMNDLPVMKKGKRLYYSKNDLLKWLQTGRKKTTTQIDKETDSFVSSKKKKR